MPENLYPTRDLVAEWRAGDAERLARLWNELGPAWPGGWMGGRTTTAEESEREFRRHGSLAAFAAETRGRFVAFCTLHEGWDKPHNAYVGLLTAHPDYHGRGYGKAVLLAAVGKAHALGYKRVTLGTWAGNTKAVPLYKKSGFMWVPDTDVNMENFTPFARQHAIGREFFAANDWYETQRRDLALKEDLFKRGKVKVYPYEWRGKEGHFLRMVFDPQSWGLLEIETKEFRAGCYLSDEKLVCGVPQKIRWEIVNRTGKPLPVSLRASGDRGVGLRFARAVVVRERQTIESQFVVDPKLPEKKKPPRVPVITTRLNLGGKRIELKAGFQAEQPVSVSMDWPRPALLPGRAQKVFFQVRSRLQARAEGRVRLEAPEGVTVEPSSAAVALRAKGAARFPATVTSTRAGKVQITCKARVRSEGRTIEPKPGKVELIAAGALECAGYVERKYVLLHSPALRVWIERENLHTNISRWLGMAGDEDEGAGLSSPALGPPFHWDEFTKERCKARIVRAGGKVTAVVEAESKHRPGLWLVRRVTVGNEPLVCFVDKVENRSSQAQELTRRTGMNRHSRRHAGFTALVEGRLVSPTPGGRGWETDSLGLHEKPEHWPEGWAACSCDGKWSAGLLWQKADEIACGPWGAGIEESLGSMAPGEARTCAPVYVYVGEGDAQAVRRWWRWLFAPEIRPDEKTEQGEPVRAAVAPEPVVVARRQRATLRVSAVGKRVLKGDVALALPRGFSPRRIAQKGCAFGGGREFAKQFTMTRQASAREGAYEGELTLDDGDHLYRRAVPMIALGAGRGAVRVVKTREGLYRVDSGVVALQVAPRFSGCVVALERRGRNYLRTDYPQAGPMAWWNPWHGGIWPSLEEPRERLYKHRCRVAVCERKGVSGATWRGVRLTWDRKKEELGGVFRYEIEYLLAPGSGIVAVAVRCRNGGALPTRYRAGFDAWPRLGGSHLEAVLHTADDAHAARKRTDIGDRLQSATWVMAENPKSGHAMLLAAAGPEADLRVGLVGRDGYLLEAHGSGRLEPGEAQERVYYVVAAESAQQARAFGALCGCAGLP